MKKVVLLGPPGAGKGTQAARLAGILGVPHISTGDIFRENIAAGTELGRIAKEYVEKGELVPDEVVVGMVRERLSRADAAGGYILDGFPRTLAQAEALEVAGELAPEVAVLLELPEEEVVARLSGRWTCPRCQRVYHERNNPPRNPGICDDDGEALIQREDDRPETIRRRLAVYREQTEPLLEYYRARGRLRVVDGGGPIEEVTCRISEATGGSS